jgi:transposase
MRSQIIVILTTDEVKELEKIDKSRTIDAAVQDRARIILDSANGLRNKDIATKRNYERHYITYWKRRWNKLYQQWQQSDPNERPKMSQKLIAKWLSDLERSGCPPTITPEQRTLILAVACEPPEKSGYPHTQWTDRLLAKEVVKRGIVPSIGHIWIWRFLKSARLKTASQPILAQCQTRRTESL